MHTMSVASQQDTEKLVPRFDTTISMSSSSCSPSLMSSPATTVNVFDFGSYPTALLSINPDAMIAAPPPKPLLIGTPTCNSPSLSRGCEFDILLLLHGYLLYNHFYSQLIQQIASHGFIVVAPQLYNIAGPDSSDEIKATAAIIDWLPKGLKDVLPQDIRANTDNISISGHSRGGKVAFALALNKVTTSPLKISALIGIDPVDGMDKGKQTPPPVLTYKPRSFELKDTPVLVIGSGLGALKRNPLFPPCAPKGVNHYDFYDECQNPAWYFLVKGYGHLDMLDDDTKGIRGKSTYCLCKNGESRKPMRRFVGGVIVAFLNGYVRGDPTQLNAITNAQENVPVQFDKVDFRA